MLHAGSSSASQLKMLVQPVVLNALILPIIVMSYFPRFPRCIFTTFNVKLLFQDIEHFQSVVFGALRGVSDAALDIYTRGAADWPCGRAERRPIPSRQYPDP